MSSPFLTFFSTARLAFGTLSTLAPGPVLSLCHVSPAAGAGTPIPGAALVMTRMFGVRDAALGALLYAADGPAAARRVLVAGAVVDAVDALGCAWAWWHGEVDVLGAELVAGGAVLFLSLGLWGLSMGGAVSAVGGGVVGKGVGK